jgi:hypothetical protein
VSLFCSNKIGNFAGDDIHRVIIVVCHFWLVANADKGRRHGGQEAVRLGEPI